MAGKQAKTLSSALVERMMAEVENSASPDRDRAIVLLSVRAGLRACEIAGLEWTMLVDPNGKLATAIALEDRVAKKQSGRLIPLHPELSTALQAIQPTQPTGPVIRSKRGGAMRPNSIVNWFVELYRRIGVNGCSSHSGRRTFITAAARNVHRVGGSLRDVQLLAGHRSLTVTQGYIEGDTDVQRKLVSLL